MNNYEIKANEPDGWGKAWAVLLNGVVIAYFRYKDSAEWYIKERIEKGL